MDITRLLWTQALVWAALVSTGAGADSAAPAASAPPKVAAASNEGRAALARFQVPRGFKVDLVAAEPMLANPVALSIDEKGRFFVAETFRQGLSATDIRAHLEWLDEDLASQSVEERVAMMRKYLGDQAAAFSKESERVSMLVDTNSDGVADTARVFADGFNGLEEGLGAGILAFGGEVYYANIPNLWLLREGLEAGKATQRQALLSGFGVRIGYWGHDLHGLRMGPEGRVYFSVGDRGANVRLPGGRSVGRTDTGAVYRCNPDGSDLELVAWGLRNPQDLVFDRLGNLWTVDNNSDLGEPARLVSVVEGGDSGWRIGYQYHKEPTNGGPWLAERLWEPQTAGGWASVLPAIATITNSGAGLAYYPGVGFANDYTGRFFVCTFHGSPSNSGVQMFSVTPKGASFEITNRGQFIWNILATDIEFGYNGSAYVTDWVEGWRASGKGRIYRVYDDIRAGMAVAADTRTVAANGFGHRKLIELVGLLTHPDMRIRLGAQCALVAMGDEAVSALGNVPEKIDDPMAWLHAVWGLGQSLRLKLYSSNSPAPVLIGLMGHTNADVRAQAARMLGDNRVAEAQPALVKALEEGPDRVRLLAGIALGRLGQKQSVPALVALVQKCGAQDRYLLHAGVMGLVGCASPEVLAALSTHPAPAVRMAGLLALRRLGRAETGAFLQDNDAAVAAEALRAIHDTPVVEALGLVAALASRPPVEPALFRRVINANFRLGGPGNAAALAGMAIQPALAENLRIEALDALGDWAAPSKKDRVTGAWNPIPARSGSLAALALQARMDEIGKTAPAGVKAAAARALERLSGPVKK